MIKPWMMKPKGIISNGDIYSSDFASIDDWANGDTGTGVSSQATFDGKSTFKLDSGVAAGNAHRVQDIGTFGARTVLSFSVDHSNIGSTATGDMFVIQIANGATLLSMHFEPAGFFILNTAASYVEVGTDLVVTGAWQEWTLDLNWTAKTLDVYLGTLLKATGVDFGYAYTGFANGVVDIYQNGTTAAHRLTCIDWFKAGSNFA